VRTVTRTVPVSYTFAGFFALSGLGLIVFTARTDAAVHLGGALVIILAAMYAATTRVVAAITATHREADAAFEAGYEMGLDKGYLDGRKANLSATVTSLENRRASAR
jgi:hypothetical protein